MKLRPPIKTSQRAIQTVPEDQSENRRNTPATYSSVSIDPGPFSCRPKQKSIFASNQSNLPRRPTTRSTESFLEIVSRSPLIVKLLRSFYIRSLMAETSIRCRAKTSRKFLGGTICSSFFFGGNLGDTPLARETLAARERRPRKLDLPVNR